MTRVLLDECVPRRLGTALTGHEVRTVADMRWWAASDRSMLQNAAGAFDVLITVDKSLPLQQNIAALQLGVIVLRARSNRYDDLVPLISRLLLAIPNVGTGEVVTIGPA